MGIRKPAVAGSFYPADPEKLRAELTRCLEPAVASKQRAVGAVAPHAGYRYSGAVAGGLYRRLDLPQKFVILSPNHTGLGVPFSIMPEGGWETPLGTAPIDAGLASRFMKNCPLLQADDRAHRTEHSLEVQIPFLQRLKKNFSFVPLTLGHISYPDCESVGVALAATLREAEGPVLIIASSDLNHYEDQETAMEKDRWAIDKSWRSIRRVSTGPSTNRRSRCAGSSRPRSC